MPTLHERVVYALNPFFHPDAIDDALRSKSLQIDMNDVSGLPDGASPLAPSASLDPDGPLPPSLPHLIRALGLDLPDDEAEFIATMPTSMAYGVVAIARHAVLRGKGIVFTWKAGYDWELSVSDTPDTPSTRGGVRIEITSRYPADPHPLRSTLSTA